MSHGTITVHPAVDGSPTVRWELTTPAADALLAMVAHVAITSTDDGERRDAAMLLDELADAVNEAEALSKPLRVEGCAGLWPDAQPYALTDAALLGDGDNLCAVLLPGGIPMLAAITRAIEEANALGADLDPTDTSLMSDYHPPRWVILHSCDMEGHDFHPEVAPHGAHTPGAVLVTQVDFTRVKA